MTLELGGNALLWPHGSGLQVQATLDHREKIWLNGTLEGRCLQTMAGYMNGKDRVIFSIDYNNAKILRLNINKKMSVQVQTSVRISR